MANRKKIILKAIDDHGDISLPDLYDKTGLETGLSIARTQKYVANLKSSGYLENGDVQGKVKLTEQGGSYLSKDLSDAPMPKPTAHVDAGGKIFIREEGKEVERTSLPELVAMDEIEAILSALKTIEEKRRVFDWLNAYFAEIF